MRKKNTLLMSVTLLILALFIGTAITPATAGLPASMPNNEKAEVAVEETVAEPVESQEECPLCADQEASSENEEESTVEEPVEAPSEAPDEGCPLCANQGTDVGDEQAGEAQTASGQNQMANDEQLIISGEPPCDSCEDIVNSAFDSVEEYIIEHLPEFDEEDPGLLDILEYVLDVRDTIIFGILEGIYTLGEPFVPYLAEATILALGTFIQSLINEKHLITAIAKLIYDAFPLLLNLGVTVGTLIATGILTAFAAAVAAGSLALLTVFFTGGALFSILDGNGVPESLKAAIKAMLVRIETVLTGIYYLVKDWDFDFNNATNKINDFLNDIKEVVKSMAQTSVVAVAAIIMSLKYVREEPDWEEIQDILEDLGIDPDAAQEIVDKLEDSYPIMADIRDSVFGNFDFFLTGGVTHLEIRNLYVVIDSGYEGPTETEPYAAKILVKAKSAGNEFDGKIIGIKFDGFPVGPDETLPMEGEPVGSEPMGSEPMGSETTQEELLGGEAAEGGARSL